jgi:hypothetical protein
MAHFYTLGYSPNPIIHIYQKNFLIKIQDLWKWYFGDTLPPDEFLLFPDTHGILLASIRSRDSATPQSRELLLKKYKQFLSDGSLFGKQQESLIHGTKVSLTLDFDNLDFDKHNHPDHSSVEMGFWDVSVADWNTLFAEAFSIVRQVSPGFMDEIDLLLDKIIPFWVSEWVHNSGSYSDFIWHIAMSYPKGMYYPEIALLEAILHEYNHNKLNLILQTQSLVLNDYSENYYSPYRPDARHIHGIYLGLHAIAWAYWVIWNAHFHKIIQLPEHWLEKAILYVLKNGLSVQVLEKYAQLTPLWWEIFDEMKAVHLECLNYIRWSNIPPETLSRAKNSLRDHYSKVKLNYPQVLS